MPKNSMPKIRSLVTLFAVLFASAGCDESTDSGSGGSSASSTTSKASTGAGSMDACPAWADAENALAMMLGCTADPNHIAGCEGPRSAAGTCTDELDAFFACGAAHADATNCSCSGAMGEIGCSVAPCQTEDDAYYQCVAALQTTAATGGG